MTICRRHQGIDGIGGSGNRHVVWLGAGDVLCVLLVARGAGANSVSVEIWRGWIFLLECQKNQRM
jgi:hypothetical protein